MTVIVYRDGIMAADTAGWFGDIAAATAQRKVKRLPDGSLTAAAGMVPQTVVPGQSRSRTITKETSARSS